MDEYDQGMDPELKKYFRKILNSFGMVMLWFFFVVTAGLFFRLAIISHGIQWYNILFYILMAASLVLLLKYLYRSWK
jgi:hypothetical protein